MFPQGQACDSLSRILGGVLLMTTKRMFVASLLS